MLVCGMPYDEFAQDLRPQSVHFNTSGIPEYVLYMCGITSEEQTIHLIWVVSSFLPFFTGTLSTSIFEGLGCLVCMWI